MNVSKYPIVNYINDYGSIMQFNKNKNTYIHGWYPFVEGYSKEFIRSIVNEYTAKYNKVPEICLEPFAGSGTTPVELQKLGIKCVSFEISPFMYNLATAKMETNYTTTDFNLSLDNVSDALIDYEEDIETLLPLTASRRIVQREGLKKWNFNKEVMKGILDIKYAINQLDNPTYIDLFRIALASILLDVSNVYRNGKCISYKKNWNTKITFSREDVHNIFLNRLRNVFYPDIQTLTEHKRISETLFSNRRFCSLGDVRENLESMIDDNSINLIITSPPYLNSRDYTDTYMPELRVLDYVSTDEEIRNLRKRTIRSHVQVKWDEVDLIDNVLLQNAILQLSVFKSKFWNEGLLNMIKGYFKDMDFLFKIFYKKVASSGLIYFNVANSAYYGVEIKTDEIVAEIAEKNGFKVIEIREARRINPSSQQKDSVPYLRESVIVIMKDPR